MSKLFTATMVIVHIRNILDSFAFNCDMSLIYSLPQRISMNEFLQRRGIAHSKTILQFVNTIIMSTRRPASLSHHQYTFNVHLLLSLAISAADRVKS